MTEKKPSHTTLCILTLVILIVLAVCISLIGSKQDDSSQTADPSSIEGSVPEADDTIPGVPIGEHMRELSSAQDLLDLAEWVNSGADDAGYSWYLANDIDMNGRSWTPIGGCFGSSKNEPVRVEHFDGQFFGQGHTVSGVSCLQSGFYGVGFFGSIGPDASISELHVQGSFAGEGNVGGIVGISSASKKGSLIAGCSFSGDIYTLDSCGGGIVGSAGERTVVLCCFSNANVYGRSRIGALAGTVCPDSQIRDCSCVGTVTAYSPSDILRKTKLRPTLYPAAHYEQLDTASSIGGLIGAANDVFLLKNCVSNVKVTSAIPAEELGDFVGSYCGQFNFCNFCAVEGNKPRTEQFYEYGDYILWLSEINKAEMAKESTFESFDFSTDWKMNSEYNIPSPVFTENRLQAFSSSAPFRLGTKGEPTTLTKGDSLGPWVLTALEITREDGKIYSLDSMFRGDVTLEGIIKRNVLLPNESYIFTVEGSELEKLPLFASEESRSRDALSFALRIPKGLENVPQLEHGETMPAQITIDSYCHVFAYRMVIDTADVQNIVPLSTDSQQ